MKIKAIFKFRYKSEKDAQISFKSLEPDNKGYITSYTDKEYLICILKGNSVGTLLSTADDLIFCETMVEKISELQ